MKTIETNSLKSVTKQVIIAVTLILNIQLARSQNLTLGLCACYPLDCDNAVDMSPNGLNATLVSGVTCTTGHTGASNTAYRFAGTASDYIELPNATCLTPTIELSWSAWVKTEDRTVEQYLVFAHNGCVSYHEGYTMVIGRNLGSGNYGFAVAKSDGCSSSANQVVLNSTAAAAIANNTWYHVGMVVTNTSLKIYINGVLNAQVSHSKNFLYPASGTKVYLGGSNLTTFNLPFLGSMDNVRFYTRELAAKEFKALYMLDPDCDNCGLATYQASLEACYPLDCNVNNSVPTSTPSLNGTANNVTCAIGHNGVSSTAYAFGGNASSYISLPNDSRLKPSAVTIACWVKIDVLQTDQYIVFTHNGCSSWHEGYAIVAHSISGNVYYEAVKSNNCNNGSGQIVVNSSAAPSSTNSWQCVVAYFYSGGVKLYVDGNAYTTTGGGALLYDPNALVYLGGTNLAFNRPLNGRIDNLKFWSKELTQTEVQALCELDVECDDWCRNTSRPGSTTGMSTIQDETSQIVIYPNPTAGKFYVRNGYSKRVVVSDITGKLVSFTASKADEKTLEITLPDQCHGIYFVKVYDTNGIYISTQKIIIQK